MGRYILARLLSLLLVLGVVSLLTFTLMHAIPGGPFDETNQRLPPATKANILRKYGLDQPLWRQYLNYMGNVLRFDFGIPYQQPTTTVSALIAQSWRVTAQIGLMTIILSFSLGLTVGTLAAYYQNSWLDNVVTFGAMLGITLPNFIVAYWLILIFSVRLALLPSGGWSDPDQWLIPGFFSKDWILPVLAYSLAPFSLVARYTRASVVEHLRQDYVRTARVKGLTEQAIVGRHILLPNAISPLLITVTFGIPAAIFGEAGLSFLGIGVNDPTPSWGKMVGVSGAYVRVYWHLGLFPTLLIALSMLGFAFVGDGLRDALDPRFTE